MRNNRAKATEISNLVLYVLEGPRENPERNSERHHLFGRLADDLDWAIRQRALIAKTRECICDEEHGIPATVETILTALSLNIDAAEVKARLALQDALTKHTESCRE